MVDGAAATSGSAVDPRQLAWQVLQKVESGGFADALLGNALSKTHLAIRDQGLAVRLVYGTLAWQGHLDHLLGTFSQKPVGKLDAPIRCLLRMALLQMCKLDRIPTFAVVNTAVELAKQYRGGSASGFVNAVLRRAARRGDSTPLPVDRLDNLAVRLSHPRWLVEQWLETYGEDETIALLQANNEAAPTVLRINRTRGDRAAAQARLEAAGHGVEPCHFSPSGLILTDPGRLESLPGFIAGEFTSQGEASQIVGCLSAPQPGQRVLDACAAPGGKTTQLAELMNNQGEIVALDIHHSGLDAIRRAATRLGLSIIKTEQADAAHWTGAPQSFDTVLVDAPCSGLGTLRQHPEIKWRRTAADIEELAATQSGILDNVAAMVRVGGALLYSTCTLTTAENEQQIARFLARHSHFEIVDPRPHLPPTTHELCGSDGIVRMFPQTHGLDGFFAVRMRRTR